MEKEYNEPENDIELEKIKFMYDKTYDELNRVGTGRLK